MRVAFLFAAAAALSLSCGDVAGAAAKHKRHKAVVHPPAGLYVPPAPSAQPRGPIWAGPNECYTDEGYGRFWPCGAGRGE
jgi:hypothetical protein